MIFKLYFIIMFCTYTDLKKEKVTVLYEASKKVIITYSEIQEFVNLVEQLEH